MDRNTLITSFVVGTGRSRPGVRILPSQGVEAFDLAELPGGHSVYAIDVDAGSDRILLGTEGGRIELLSWREVGESSRIQRMHSLLQGSPVLSVCLLEESLLAATDTAGRCLLWRPAIDPNRPQMLETKNGCICSLLRLPGNRLLGLSAEGRLLVWDTGNGGRLLSTVDAPSPPEILALVRLLYWPAQDAVAYATGDGRLAVCNLNEMKVSTRPAHKGEFYVILADQERLYTIGRSDGLLKTWQDMNDSPSQEMEAPRSIISGHLLEGDSLRALLVNEAGEAGIYSLEGNAIRLVGLLRGNHHRSVSGASAQACREHRQRQRLSKARQLQSQIRTDIDNGRFDSTETLYKQLSDLGFKKVSLSLRARQAQVQQDILSELKHRRDLADSLSPDDPRSLASLRHYVDVLQRAWCVRGAKEVDDLINTTIASSPNWLSMAADALRGEDWIIEPDIEIPVLVRAATLMGQHFIGLWTHEIAQPVTFPEGDLTAERLAAKYEQVKYESKLPDLHRARARKVWWISRGIVRQAEIVILESSLQQGCMGLHPAVRILSGELQNSFVPMSLFHAGRPQPEETFQDHNHQVMCAHEWISQQELVDPWPRKVRQVLSLALRRLHTEAIARRADERMRHVTAL